jgi:hypothetical protein
MNGKETAKGAVKRGGKGRKVAIDGATADLLQARAAALGISVAELIAAIAGNKPAAPITSNGMAPNGMASNGDAIRAAPAANGDTHAAATGDIPGAKVAPPDARWREVKAWIDSWGKSDELPRPKLGK